MRSGTAGVALAALACAAVHVTFVGGTFLSDDFGHLLVIYHNFERGTLLSWVAVRFVEPLGNASFAYRPLAFASYALDWLAYRTFAPGWRTTSLLLVAANAFAAALVLHKWLAGRAAGTRVGAWVGACMFAAYPFAGEISYWLVGRFDLLACLFSLLYLLCLPLDRTSTAREHVLRLAFLACALGSKESAIPLPAVGTLILAWGAREQRGGVRETMGVVRRVAIEMGPSFALLAAYLLWRVYLFGSALKVYTATTRPGGIAEWWQRWSGLGDIAAVNIGQWWIPWAVACALLVTGLALANLRSPRAAATLAVPLLAAFALYAVSPALSFPVSSPSGEGGRHFYLAWLYASLLAGVLVSWRPAAWPLGLALVALCVAGQFNSLRQWHAAGVIMSEVTPAIGEFATTIRDDQYALVLLPDHIGAALFARTAQGALVAPPIQARDELPRIAPTLGTDLDRWSALLTDGWVAKLKSTGAFDLANFTGLFCWNPSRRAIVALTAGADVARDPAAWEAAAHASFAVAGCLEPF